MIKYTLYIGSNDKDKKIQLLSDDCIRGIIHNTIKSNGVDGFTLSQAFGYYTHENGETVIEKSYRVEMFFIDIKQVKAIVESLKKLLNQESIVVEKTRIESTLM